jgi:hypothetical protein
VPVKPPTETVERGLSVRRHYIPWEKDAGETFRQGDLVRVRIAVRSPVTRGDVVVADLLPGGFEIEDSTLKTRSQAAVASNNMAVEHVERLDDRLLLFCTVYGSEDQPATFTYTARAVTRGTYTVPRISAECMYEPGVVAAYGELGTIEIN